MNLPTLKLQTQKINPEVPWGDDKLGRRTIADSLTNLLKDEQGSLVLGLNGGWGSGKTFLLKRWEAQLKNEGFEVIYFNAWEDDFVEDPLVAILGQIWESIKKPEYMEIIESAKTAAKPVLAKTVFNVLRIKTLGLLDYEAKDFESIPESILGDYAAFRCERTVLKDRLTDLALKVQKKTEHPLIFIVDELDRCRPTFAIEVLERIKHIFDVEHLVFVLGVDRKQLCSSIASVYGNIDVDGYLRRFFDIEFSIPIPKIDAYCEFLLEQHGFTEYFKELTIVASHSIHESEYREARNTLSKLAIATSLSLREVEQCVRCFSFAARSLQPTYYMYPTLLTILLITRIKDIKRYYDYVHQNYKSKDILNWIGPQIQIKNKNGNLNLLLDDIEVNMYSAEPEGTGRDMISAQLKSLSLGNKIHGNSPLSDYALSLDHTNAKQLFELYESVKLGLKKKYPKHDDIKRIIGWIELVQFD